MTITLEFRPEIEERLRENAAGAGLSVEEYLLRIAEEGAAPSREFTSSVSEGDSNGAGGGQPIRIDPAALDRLRLSTEPGAYPPGSLAELFAQWQAEDATDDPEELARRDRELEELKANLNANRAACGDEPLFP